MYIIYRMRYIFIYYNISYIILLIFVYIYIKKVLNNCYNIEEFEGTHENGDTNDHEYTNNPIDSTNKPIDETDETDETDEIDKIFKSIIKQRGVRRREILNNIEDSEKGRNNRRYIVDPKDYTNVNDIKLYKSEYGEAQKIIDEIDFNVTARPVAENTLSDL